jgi:hypothetical protein
MYLRPSEKVTDYFQASEGAGIVADLSHAAKYDDRSAAREVSGSV